MATLFLSLTFLLFISFSRITCHNSEYHTFFQCINSHSTGRCRLLKLLHTPSSPVYASLLESSTQNQRWFNDTSQRPFLIVTPHAEHEIRPVILCSRVSGHHVRSNSGGHDYEGLSFRAETPFIMILMSNLNRTDIDIKQETAWIQTGVRLGQLYYEIYKESGVHAFPAGLYPTVGSGGHISGGGLGTLMRKHGLASDNVLDARIMNADGNILDRRGMGEDLFWALRGGGGSSFGVILAWKLRLVRVPPRLTAFTVHRQVDPMNLGLLHKWQEYAHRAPDDLFVRIIVQSPTPVNGSGMEKSVYISYNGLFVGPAEQFVPLVNKTFPEFDLTVEDCLNHTVTVNYSCTKWPCVKKECFQAPWIKSVLYFSGKKPTDPPEILLKKVNSHSFYKGTSDFLKSPIPDEGWRTIHEALLNEEHPMIIVDPLGGKMDKFSEDETPFVHRKGNLFNMQYLTYWGENSESKAKKHMKWMRDLRRKTEPYVAKSPRTAYINYKDLDVGRNDANFSYNRGKVWGEKYFKANFKRLAIVKGQVDPSNFFRNEQSIPILLQ